MTVAPETVPSSGPAADGTRRPEGHVSSPSTASRSAAAQGRADHPGRRAARHRDPAVLRPPAARAGRRLPAVPGRGGDGRPADAEAAGLLHHDGRRRHGRQDPAHLAGGRQGAAGHDGAAADQPPAGLPDLRQGRRVPAAEPGAGQRPRRVPVRRRRSGPTPSRSPISSQILLDRERCVLCARCTRFSEQIAGDPFIELFERGALEQIGVDEDEPFESYFSGNTIQICPVGALTSAAYRFRARPFDLVSTPSVCEHCASGCAQRTDWRRGKVTRRLAGEDPAVNEEWNCDKGRFAFRYATSADRHPAPLVRDDETGELVETSWTDALAAAAEGLRAASDNGGVGVLPGGRLTVEDAYAYAKFARVALGTNDVDARARAHSAEELDFLAAQVAGTGPGRPAGSPTPTWRRRRPCCCVGFEPEEESPIVFLRLRKAARNRPPGLPTSAPFAPAAPREAVRHAAAPRSRRRGRRPSSGLSLARRAGRTAGAPSRRCGSRGGDPGRRAAAEVPGLFSAVLRLADAHRRPGWPGCRGGPASAARSRPARCRTCCPAAAGHRPGAAGRGRAGLGPGSGPLPATPGRDTDRHPGRGGDRRAGRAAGRRRRPGRPARPGARARAAGPGRVRGQPGAAASAGHRAGRRGAAGRRRRRRSPAPSWTGRAAPAPFDAPRWTAPARCPTAGCWTRWPRRWTSTCSRRRRRPRAAELARAGHRPPGRRGRPPDGAGRRRPPPPGRRPGACWPAGGSCSTAARCRTASRTWPARPEAAGGPAVAGDRRPGSASSTATTVTVAPARGAITLPAALTDHAGRRGLAAGELAAGSTVRSDPAAPAPARGRLHAQRRRRMRSASRPPQPDHGWRTSARDPFWLVLIKVVAIFVLPGA